MNQAPQFKGSLLNTVAFWMALVIVFISALCVRAEDKVARFETGNKLYEEGKFKEAAALYENLLQSGQSSAALYFNLGNALFKSGQIGRAIAAYRQAQRITPRDPDIRANLQFARNQIQGPTLSLNAWQRWLGKLSMNEWTIMTAGALWLLLLLLVVRQLKPSLKPALRGSVVALLVATVLLGSCLAVFIYQSNSFKEAVVIIPEAVVRHGPLEESQRAFTAVNGAELQVLDQKDQWLQVTTGPRRVGWVRRDQVLVIPQS